MIIDENDDDLKGEEWKGVKKPKKLKTNPSGPYNVKFKFKNIEWNISIENVTDNDYQVTARSNVKVDENEIEILKNYLQEEGFEEEAKKHNLYWFL
jgi:hypothetical protein